MATTNIMKEPLHRKIHASQYLSTLLDNIDEPVIATDENYIIRYWNRGAENLFGKKASDVEGKEITSAIQFIYPETSHERIRNNMLYKGLWKGELQYHNGQGLLTLDTSITAIKDEKDNIRGYVGVHRNITELKQSEGKLLAALVKEHQLSDMKSRFVALASHEFRTPFSTILSSSNIIEKYKNAEEQSNRVKHTNKIREAIHHMNAILEDFLSLSRLEEGKITVSLYPCNINSLILETIKDLEYIRRPGQVINYSYEGEEEISTDKKLLKSVLVNVISNAIKYSSEHKTINIHSSIINNKLLITVEDEGIGIPEDDQENLFKSFHRGKNAHCIQGTGLGLHISGRYIHLLKGEIKLISEVNKGTVVTITL